MKLNQDRFYSFAMKVEDGYCEIYPSYLQNLKTKKDCNLIKSSVKKFAHYIATLLK